ncbi:Uncharacterised protein [Mycobacteroides abscessus subsp. bolletii]|uniref:hypothetical protein n=1 Tax=Mycobacteroides abscessus TaxID=36809 RepID=UPI0009A8E206|nr:hypothetical protein [Mycobacteroides abscessus]SKZ02934.1 Uncharacterised protein [Mycobacteroides abscessus subsp. bolletii]
MSGLDVLVPTDTHNLPITSYPICLDNGILSKFFGGGLAELQLAIMKFTGFIDCSIVNIVTLFNWLSPVVDLLEKVSDQITGMLGAIGIVAMATTVGFVMWVVHWLKGTTHRILYHLAIALLLMVIGVFMVSPVRWAAQSVTLGGGAATEIGQASTGTTETATISQILATKFMREPLFRANFGVNLDEIRIDSTRTCGDVFDAAIRNGASSDEIRDAIGAQCPGGKALVKYSKNPVNLNFELLLGNAALIMLFIVIGFISVRVMMSGVATVWHAAMLKPSIMFAMAGPSAQTFAIRNAVAIPLGGIAVFGDLLVLVLVAVFTGVIAVATGSSAIASVITQLCMVGLILGTWQFSRNLRGGAGRLAERATGASTPATGAIGIQQARQAVQRVITKGSSVAATLSGNPAAAAAVSQLSPKLGPGTLGGPRSTALMHRRGHTPQALPQGGGAQPAAGGPNPQAGLGQSPVSAASQVAYTTRQQVTTKWNPSKPGAVTTQVKYETIARPIQPRPPKPLPASPSHHQGGTQQTAAPSPSPAASRRQNPAQPVNTPSPASPPPRQSAGVHIPTVGDGGTQRATDTASQNRNNRRAKP